MTHEIDRRGFLPGSAATVGAALAGSALYSPHAHAQAAARIAVPTVDRLAVRVVSDGSHDIFISGEAPKNVSVERGPRPAPAAIAEDFA